MRLLSLYISCFLYSFLIFAEGDDSSLVKLKVIEGKISPKSIVHSGKGKFFAQNMMYKHTITVYDRNFNLLKTISDKIELKNFGFPEYKGTYRGAPVECAFSHDGKYAWVSNYNMSGGEDEEFTKPGCDDCSGKGIYDSSFLYKINTESLVIESVVKVGSVPKFVAVSPNNKFVLVTNWSSGDISIVDIEKEKEVKRIRLGTFPRGIVVNKLSDKAYVAIMGSSKIAEINLNNFSISYIKDVGKSPRHLCLSPDGKVLYASLNGEGVIAKINLLNQQIEKLKTGRMPRSMEISKDGKFLYVVNYGSDKLTKVRTESWEVATSVKTNDKPIGVTFDSEGKNIWVACYEGSLMVFHDSFYDTIISDSSEIFLADKMIGKTIEFKRNTTRSVEKSQRKVSETKVEEKEVEYLLVAGSFKDEANAGKKSRELKKAGYSSFTFYNEKNKFTYACLARYISKEDAVNAVEQVKAKGESVWVYKNN